MSESTVAKFAFHVIINVYGSGGQLPDQGLFTLVQVCFGGPI